MIREKAYVLKTFDLSGSRFSAGDEFFIPHDFYKSQLPSQRDKVLANLFADGYLDDLSPNWLETQEAKDALVENPLWAASSYCANCKGVVT